MLPTSESLSPKTTSCEKAPARAASASIRTSEENMPWREGIRAGILSEQADHHRCNQDNSADEQRHEDSSGQFERPAARERGAHDGDRRDGAAGSAILCSDRIEAADARAGIGGRAPSA